ncbi:hypothetical protein C4D60_Mb08t27580 [Musa balbisiana]|uniref:Uncharacterized protein n=1 Tax=Musa balbisiana TaxID=52838 RepID=A0A4V4H990_MUSBA|nr:hypothetical protein C4D60_Mb08t27580 [Musa balbisiana]
MESKQSTGLGSGSGRTGSSRKGKKERSKQPQRGLGVAQLEEIRLQSQMDEYVSSLNPPFGSNLNVVSLRSMHVSFGDAEERGIIHYGEHWPRWQSDQRRSVSSSHCYVPPTLTLSLFEHNTEEDSAQKRNQHDPRLGSISQSSDTNDAQELDLDLKLSL